jgi:hypothetical protein
MKFALVRREPSEKALSRADSVTDLIDAATHGDDTLSAADHRSARLAEIGLAYQEIVAASEEPTPEELDELCRMMWGEEEYWDSRFDAEQSGWRTTKWRNEDRSRMRAFIKALSA